MPGAKIPILEVEKLRIANDGAGIDFVNDGTIFLKSRVWSGSYPQTGSADMGGTAKRPLCLCAGSSSGWLRMTVRSGSTNTSYYVPIFSAVDTKLSS